MGTTVCDRTGANRTFPVTPMSSTGRSVTESRCMGCSAANVANGDRIRAAPVKESSGCPILAGEPAERGREGLDRERLRLAHLQRHPAGVAALGQFRCDARVVDAIPG